MYCHPACLSPIQFPLPRAQCSLLANSSFLSFGVNLKSVCYPCPVPDCIATVGECSALALDSRLKAGHVTRFGQQNEREVVVGQDGAEASESHSTPSLPSPREEAQPSLLEAERHMEQSEGTAVTMTSLPEINGWQSSPRM